MRKSRMDSKYFAIILSTGLVLGLTACSGKTTESNDSDTIVTEVAEDVSDDNSEDTANNDDTATDAEVGSTSDIETNETIENTADGEHAITADGETAEYSNVKVIKSGEADGDEADFYGENAAIFATNGATLDLSDIEVESNGTHANGVFSYGEGTTVNINNATINTSGNCSGGLMTTGGGTMNAENLTIHTTGNSSAAIRSDRGGGTVNVTGGSYTTDGTGSPVIYSTADITVNNATMESTASQGVVVEGKNSVTLNNVSLTADNNTKNSDKSEYYQAVMIYQSMSGDAAEGTAGFAMNGSTLTNRNGEIFFINNTVAEISLSNNVITNEDSEGVFLRAASAGWGSEGSNGGNVTLNADNQEIDGNIIVDSVSTLNLYLKNNSALNGSINSESEGGEVYVELSDGATWTLTDDSYISSLTCGEDSINLNGHKLYINGEEYKEGSASTGEAVEAKVSEGGQGMEAPPDGENPSDDQAPPSGEKSDGEPPAKPDGEKPDGEPPAKPGDSSSTSQ